MPLVVGLVTAGLFPLVLLGFLLLAGRFERRLLGPAPVAQRRAAALSAAGHEPAVVPAGQRDVAQPPLPAGVAMPAVDAAADGGLPAGVLPASPVAPAAASRLG